MPQENFVISVFHQNLGDFHGVSSGRTSMVNVCAQHSASSGVREAKAQKTC